MKLYNVSCAVTFSCAGQKVERSGEIVVDANRRDDDHRDNGRLQQRQNDREEHAQRRRAIDDGGLIDLSRDGRHERAEDQGREGHGECDFDHDQAEERLVETKPLQKKDRRHDGRRDDESGKHDRTGNRRHPITAALHHEGDERREQDDQRHRAHGQEGAVPQRQKHAVVAKCQDLPDVLDQLKLARPAELEEGSLLARLGSGQENEHKRHDKDDADDNESCSIYPDTRNELA